MSARVGRAAGASPAMALPALVFFAVFALLPMALVLVLSFTRWNGLGPASTTGARWRASR